MFAGAIRSQVWHALCEEFRINLCTGTYCQNLSTPPYPTDNTTHTPHTHIRAAQVTWVVPLSDPTENACGFFGLACPSNSVFSPCFSVTPRTFIWAGVLDVFIRARGEKPPSACALCMCRRDRCPTDTHFMQKVRACGTETWERHRRARGTEAELTVTTALLSKGICYLSKHALGSVTTWRLHQQQG